MGFTVSCQTALKLTVNRQKSYFLASTVKNVGQD